MYLLVFCIRLLLFSSSYRILEVNLTVTLLLKTQCLIKYVSNVLSFLCNPFQSINIPDEVNRKKLVLVLA